MCGGWAITCGSVRVAPQPQMHGLGEGQVALVGEGRVDQFGGVALVLVRVVELGLHHPHESMLTPTCTSGGRRGVRLGVEPQLLLPVPAATVT